MALALVCTKLYYNSCYEASRCSIHDISNRTHAVISRGLYLLWFYGFYYRFYVMKQANYSIFRSKHCVLQYIVRGQYSSPVIIRCLQVGQLNVCFSHLIYKYRQIHRNCSWRPTPFLVDEIQRQTPFWLMKSRGGPPLVDEFQRRTPFWGAVC